MVCILTILTSLTNVFLLKKTREFARINKAVTILTENQRKCISEWRLTPHQARGVNSLSRAVDVAPTHPRGCSGKYF